jgi:predicted transcriptional regulator
MEEEPMASAKQLVREILELLPEDRSLQDIQYHLQARQQIEEGREDIRAGRTHTQEEIEQDVAQWLGR